MLVVRAVISVLCAAGFYASVFMLRKHMSAERGEVQGPSVVKTRRAKLFAGLPNSLLGIPYYAGVVVVVWAAHAKLWFMLAEAAAVLAAATSLYLAYSLLFVTKRSCPYCWTSHAVNWSLVAVLPLLI